MQIAASIGNETLRPKRVLLRRSPLGVWTTDQSDQVGNQVEHMA